MTSPPDCSIPPRYETSLQEERSHIDPDRFSTTSSNRIPRGPPKRVESEKVRSSQLIPKREA